MTRSRQFVSALMVLALLVVLNAPLLACEQAGQQCAMMDHHSAQVEPSDATSDMGSDDAMAMPEHDCCPRKGSEPSKAPARQCHETTMVMPAECATSSNCCDMGNAPVVSELQAAPIRKILVAVEGPLAPDLVRLARSTFESANAERSPQKPVFELKADLRI